MNEIQLYTDGSAHPNNGAGNSGGGVVIKNGQNVVGFSKFFGVGTNNTAEIRAIMYGLSKVMSGLHNVSNWQSFVSISVYSDSEYAINSLSGVWALTPTKKNFELIKEAQEVVREFPNINFSHIRGHAGHKYNELADKLASDGRLGKEERYEEFTK